MNAVYIPLHLTSWPFFDEPLVNFKLSPAPRRPLLNFSPYQMFRCREDTFSHLAFRIWLQVWLARMVFTQSSCCHFFRFLGCYFIASEQSSLSNSTKLPHLVLWIQSEFSYVLFHTIYFGLLGLFPTISSFNSGFLSEWIVKFQHNLDIKYGPQSRGFEYLQQ